MKIAPFIFDREAVLKLLILFALLICFSSGAAYIIADQFACQSTLNWITFAVTLGMTLLGPAFLQTDDYHDEMSKK